jgi:amino acid transporter
MVAAEGSGVTLKREEIGLADVLFQAITHMAPAVGVAFAIIVGAPLAGGSLPLAVLLALIGCALTASSVAQLSKHLPTAGSFYTWSSQAIHPSLGFLLGWVYALGEATGFPLCIALLGVVVPGTLQETFGVGGSLWWPWVVGGSLIVFALAYFGIRISTRTGVVLGAFQIAVMLALGVWLIFEAGGNNTLQVFGTKFATVEGFTGFSGVFAGVIFSVFAYIGFEAAAPLAEETKDPRRNIPRAALGSAIGIGLFYTIITYGATVFFGPAKMADFFAFGGGNPYQALARDVWGAGWVLVFLALCISSVACSNAANNATTRTWYALGRIRLFPAAVGHVHRRYRTPDGAIIAAFVASVAVNMWLGFQYDPLTAFAILGVAITLVALAVYIIINVSCMAYYLRFRRDEFNPIVHGLIPLGGIALFIPALLSAAGIKVFKFVSPLPWPLSSAGIAIGVWTLIGLIYLAYLYRAHPQRLQDTKKVFLEEEVPEAVEI